MTSSEVRRSIDLVFLPLAWLSLCAGWRSQTGWEASGTIHRGSPKKGRSRSTTPRGPFDKVFADFKALSRSQVVSVTGRGGDLIARMMTERRAGKISLDLHLWLRKAHRCSHIRQPRSAAAYFALPEVKAQSAGSANAITMVIR
jgi:hypothetical protein